MFYIYF